MVPEPGLAAVDSGTLVLSKVKTPAKEVTMRVETRVSRRLVTTLLGAVLSSGIQCAPEKHQSEARKTIEPVARAQVRTEPISNASQIVSCVPIPVHSAGVQDGCFVDDQHIWAYGMGNPLRSSDLGRSWEEMKPSETATEKWTTGVYLRPVFVSATRGWLIGDRHTWQTEDGGLTWRRIFRYAANVPHFADDRYGWMSVAVQDSGEQSYTSDNGGETWVPCSSVRSYKNGHTISNAAYFLNRQIGWAITHKSVARRTVGGVARTTDGGCTWDQLWVSNKERDETYSDIFFVDRNEGWLAGIYTGSLLHTTDGGRNWDNVPLPMRYQRVWFVYFQNSKDGWIVTQGGPVEESGFFRTMNGGRTWRHLSSSELGAPNSLKENLIPDRWRNGKLAQALMATDWR